MMQVPAFAQGIESVLPEIERIIIQEETEQKVDEGDKNPAFFLPSGFGFDEETRAAAQEAIRGFYKFRSDAFDHRRQLFAWQFVSSIVIFFIVIGVVFLGLYFSWRQFHDTKNKNKIGTTIIEAGEKGISVSSPVLGVIILVISLAFFYLYLIYVYPINDLVL